MKTTPESKKEAAKGRSASPKQAQKDNGSGQGSRQGLITSQTRIYPKLEVGAANDPAEREADLAAEQVMRGGKVSTGHAGAPDQPGALRMKANSAAQGGMNAPASVESGIQKKRGKGGSLPQPIQQKLSHTFGTDFSGVKVHTDSTSQDMNAQLRAKAFTQGSDMFFGKGQYAPGTAEGDRLIAHEAAHVVQQNGAGLIHNKGLIQRATEKVSFNYKHVVKEDDSNSQIEETPGFIEFSATLSDGMKHPEKYMGKIGLDAHKINHIDAKDVPAFGIGVPFVDTYFSLDIGDGEFTDSGFVKTIAQHRNVEGKVFDAPVVQPTVGSPEGTIALTQDLFLRSMGAQNQQNPNHFTVTHSLGRIPFKVTRGDADDNAEASGWNFFFDALGNAGLDTKTNVSIQVDGSDLLFILTRGKGKTSAKMSQSKFNSTPDFKDVFGPLNEILKKQKATYTLNQEMSLKFRSGIAYAYQSSSSSKDFFTSLQEITFSEDLATVNYEILITNNFDGLGVSADFKVGQYANPINKEAIDAFINDENNRTAFYAMKSVNSATKLIILGDASEEGNYEANRRLAFNRADTIRNYIMEKSHDPNSPVHKIKKENLLVREVYSEKESASMAAKLQGITPMFARPEYAKPDQWRRNALIQIYVPQQHQ
jgi:Domain of unknown function (DUF4157)